MVDPSPAPRSLVSLCLDFPAHTSAQPSGGYRASSQPRLLTGMSIESQTSRLDRRRYPCRPAPLSHHSARGQDAIHPRALKQAPSPPVRHVLVHLSHHRPLRPLLALMASPISSATSIRLGARSSSSARSGWPRHAVRMIFGAEYIGIPSDDGAFLPDRRSLAVGGRSWAAGRTSAGRAW